MPYLRPLLILLISSTSATIFACSAFCQEAKQVRDLELLSTLKAKRQVLRLKYSSCRSERLVEFTNGDVVEQFSIRWSSIGNLFCQQSRLQTTSRNDKIVDGLRWRRGFEESPDYNVLNIENATYSASAGISSEDRGIRSIETFDEKKHNLETSVLCDILEGKPYGVDLESRLSRDEILLVSRVSENVLAVRTDRPTVGTAPRDDIEWQFDERYGNCLRIRKTDAKGIMSIENEYEQIDGCPIPTVSKQSYPDGKSKRTTYWKSIDLVDKPKLSEFYLSFYGFPEPKFSYSFGLPIKILVGLGVAMIAASLWVAYRKRREA